MSILTPGRRWQSNYYKYQRDRDIHIFFTSIKMLDQGPLWGCKHCGNCFLQETAFICPLECPIGICNGPCDGSSSECCYIDETRPCVWFKIYERAFNLGRQELLMEVLPPVDWEQFGGEKIGRMANQVKKASLCKVFFGLISSDDKKREEAWKGIFPPVRQPEWWRGDADYHLPTYSEPASELERRLKAGQFVVTAELQPPQTVSIEELNHNIDLVKPYVIAVNFANGVLATPRMSSLACSTLTVQRGLEPVLQFAARETTRITLQSQVLGASALGIRNILCLTGESNKLGPAPHGPMDIVDLDSIQMLWVLRRMRDEVKYLDENENNFPPKYFLGAAAMPCASRPEFQAICTHKKVNAGAQFFQTNPVYDADRIEIWLNELAKRNILDKVYILVGISPLKSFNVARHLKAEVPGVFMPDSIIHRMEAAETAGNAPEEGIQITLEIIGKIRKIQGVHGLHIITVGWEEIVPRIVNEAGLLPENFQAPAVLN